MLIIFTFQLIQTIRILWFCHRSLPNDIAREQDYRFLWPPDQNVSSRAKQIGTPVLPTYQDEVLHRRGRYGELSLSNSTNSSGRTGLSNHPLHQKVSTSKLASHRHPLGRRHIETLGTHHLICLLRHYCPNNKRGTITLGNIKRPRAGTINNVWNSGPNQRRSEPLGRGCSDLPDMHLRPASIEEANHQRLRDNVLGHLE
jgi:hypothetical protein